MPGYLFKEWEGTKGKDKNRFGCSFFTNRAGTQQVGIMEAGLVRILNHNDREKRGFLQGPEIVGRLTETPMKVGKQKKNSPWPRGGKELRANE